MASSSASISCSHYDVFINHRGPDVKDTFASHLYRRLLDHGLSVFLDREELEEGHNISSQIEQAIGGASVHIAIFSERYAESYWCLNELVFMKNSEATSPRRVTILPIFFKVDPSEVRHTEKNGRYAEALRMLQDKRTTAPQTGEGKPRYGPETIQSWRTALSYVAGLSGFELKTYNGDEGELLDDVLQSVLKNLPKQPLYVAEHPTGLDQKLKEFEKKVLQEKEEQVKLKVVGIVGVGGVGKTTLAKAFFNRHRSNYNESSFIVNVREMSPNILKSKLIKGLKLGNIETECPEEGIRKHPLSCHALIVLDDVNDANQREVLLPIKDILSPGSLILVTSRDKHVLESYGVLERSLYYLKALNITQSKQLFCCYALHQPHPLPGFVDLVDRFVRVCNGLPLLLKVVGALVSGRQNDYWEDQLVRLQSSMPKQIESCFKISYDSLEENDQSIFLDIACFFIGEHRNKAIWIWGKAGLQNLEDKCLIEVDSKSKINMHDHIRDLARKIANEVSMPRRIWLSTTNITHVLMQQSSPVRREVHGITMVSSRGYIHLQLSNTKSSQIPPIKSSQIRHLLHNFHFNKLQVLATEEDYVEDILREQPPNLRWLRWYRYSHSSLPDWIPMTNLRVLEMEGSSLNILWPHQSQVLPLDLRDLNISAPLSQIPRSIGRLKYLERIVICNHSKAVTVERLPDEFCFLRCLKYLVFKGFSRMVSLPVSFGALTNLQLINLDGASSLLRLPSSFGNLTRLKYLSLRGCENLTISDGSLGDITMLEYLDLSSCMQVIDLPPQVAHQRFLQMLYLQETKLKKFPSVIGDLCNLEVLKLSSDMLEVLPLWLGDLKSLKVLSLSSSPQLKSLPDSIVLLTQLTHLDIKNCRLEYLPEHLLKMNNLESLEVSDCPLRELPFKRVVGERETLLSLEGERELNKLNSSIERCMFGLKRLVLSGTEIRELYFEEGVCPNLQQLSLIGCHELRQIGWLCGLPKSRDLNIRSCCVNVEELPGPETLISLKMLDAQGCDKLGRIEGSGQLTKRRKLNLNGCREIHELPSVEHLTALKWLSVSGCEKLRSIPGLEQLTKITKLNLSGCSEIRELPGMECLTSLDWLSVNGCQKLKSILGLRQFTKLTRLNVSGCREIQELPGVECLTSLEWLSVRGCEKLRSVPGLGQFTKLRTLDVGQFREIQELPGVEYLTSLEFLRVGGCEKLRSIPVLEQLTKLRKLNVSGCREIQELRGVECLTSLEWLSVSGCEKLRSIPRLEQLTNLTKLGLGGCSEIRELPGVEYLTALERLSVRGCEKLRSIPELGQLTKLTRLNVSGCREIQELPGVECLTSLEWLSVRGCEKLRSVPGLGQFTKLTKLGLGGCSEIRELPGVEYLTALERLSVRGCEKLRSIPELGQLTKLTRLNVSGCREIQELPGVKFLTKLTRLNVSGCREIQELPGVEFLTSLEWLSVRGCEKLRSVPGLGQFTKLRTLDVGQCREIQELPGVEYLTSLELLKVGGCEKLKSIPVLEQLTKLRELNVSGCREIQDLRGVECLTSLEWLSVNGCEKLRSVPGLGLFTKLRTLDVGQCPEIQELPGVEYLTSLEWLSVSGCEKLRSIPGLPHLTKLRELYLRECYEIGELPGVDHLMSLKILEVCNCPKLQWGRGVLEQLRQQLMEGLKYEKQSKRCSVLPFVFF